MNTPAGASEAEELSFGDDFSRDHSSLRSWVRDRRRRLLAGLVVVVLLAGAGGGVSYLHERSRGPLPPPDGPWPEQREFAVGLCHELISGCEYASKEAAKDTAGMAAALRAVAGVEGVRFRGDPAAIRSLREREQPPRGRPEGVWTSRVLDGTAYGAAYLDVTTATANFVGTVRRWDDYARVRARVVSMPGVFYVAPVVPDFWRGKADVAVDLCSRGPGLPCTGVRDRSVTEAQKQAIVDRLWDVGGVERIYFEDHAHRRKVRERYERPEPEPGSEDASAVSLDEMTESFYVKLADRRAIAVIGESIKDMPGVHYVRAIDAA